LWLINLIIPENNKITIPGKTTTAAFLERPNRFLVKIRLNSSSSSEIVPAFLHDPGRMKELLLPEVRLLVRRPVNPGPNRKTNWDVLAVESNNQWIVINSAIPNLVAKKMLQQNWLSEFQQFTNVRPEVPYHNSRFDFLLRNTSEQCFVEVKGVTLVQKQQALFPDAPTKRGSRHLEELIKALKEGFQTAVLFLVMRNDANSFSANKKTDPTFYQQLVKAKKAGVKILVYKVQPYIENNHLSVKFLSLNPLPVEF
jgi:sugar fermentation stimulation protein A